MNYLDKMELLKDISDWKQMINEVVCGDCLEGMKLLPDKSVDAVVTDPPYGLGFMGKLWDKGVPSKEIWAECLRVLKPGGYLLAFAGTRTQHRMAVNIEDSGFEIRDMIAWVYGSGFPKSLNISKALNKVDGVKFDKIPAQGVGFMNESDDGYNTTKNQLVQSGESSERAKKWEGWGTALKPALEPITLARKPLSEKTVALNCLKWGTGGINIDESRVGIDPVADASQLRTMNRSVKEEENGWGMNQSSGDKPQVVSPSGRFPANLIHDGSEEVEEVFPESTSTGGINGGKLGQSVYGKFANETIGANAGGLGDSGSASRFFYVAKADKEERNRTYSATKNNHPTVKPLDLIVYLVKLISREGAIVLDPFMGSWTTALACQDMSRDFIGFELSEDYCQIGEERLRQQNLF